MNGYFYHIQFMVPSGHWHSVLRAENVTKLKRWLPDWLDFKPDWNQGKQVPVRVATEYWGEVK